MADFWDTVYCGVAGADGVVCDGDGKVAAEATAAGAELELDDGLFSLPWLVATEIITISAITPKTVAPDRMPGTAHRFRGGGCTGCHGGC